MIKSLRRRARPDPAAEHLRARPPGGAPDILALEDAVMPSASCSATGSALAAMSAQLLDAQFKGFLPPALLRFNYYFHALSRNIAEKTRKNYRRFKSEIPLDA